jgi:hypothetical protein
MAIAIRKGQLPFKLRAIVSLSRFPITDEPRALVNWPSKMAIGGFPCLALSIPEPAGIVVGGAAEGVAESNGPGREFSSDVAFDKLFTSARPRKLIESRRSWIGW